MSSREVPSLPIAPEKLEMFNHFKHDSLTYGDVAIGGVGNQIRSYVTAETADTHTWISENVPLNSPFGVAAMDTVAAPEMAIAAAEEGGIAIVPASYSIEDQLGLIKKVRYHMGGAVDKAITLTPEMTIGDVLALRARKNWDFGNFPVIDEDEMFVGLMKSEMFKLFSRDRDRLIGDVMKPAQEVVTAPPGMEAKHLLGVMQQHGETVLPIIEDGKVKGLYVWKDVDHQLNLDTSLVNTTSEGKLRVLAAVSTREDWEARAKAIGPFVDGILINTARGESGFVFDVLETMLAMEGRTWDVLAGNVSNRASAKALVDAGAQSVFVGQGSGAICDTRKKTGFGMAQVTADFRCAEAVWGSGIPVVSDGGIVDPGDFSKAAVAGAWAFVSGGRYAGCDEAPGEIVVIDGVEMAQYDGMASAESMARNPNNRARYNLSDKARATEGVAAYVPRTGSVHEVMSLDREYLRQSMAYIGSPDLHTHRAQSTFTRQSNAAARESHPHDVVLKSHLKQ